MHYVIKKGEKYLKADGNFTHDIRNAEVIVGKIHATSAIERGEKVVKVTIKEED